MKATENISTGRPNEQGKIIMTDEEEIIMTDKEEIIMTEQETVNTNEQGQIIMIKHT